MTIKFDAIQLKNSHTDYTKLGVLMFLRAKCDIANFVGGLAQANDFYNTLIENGGYHEFGRVIEVDEKAIPSCVNVLQTAGCEHLYESPEPEVQAPVAQVGEDDMFHSDKTLLELLGATMQYWPTCSEGTVDSITQNIDGTLAYWRTTLSESIDVKSKFITNSRRKFPLAAEGRDVHVFRWAWRNIRKVAERAEIRATLEDASKSLAEQAASAAGVTVADSPQAILSTKTELELTAMFFQRNKEVIAMEAELEALQRRHAEEIAAMHNRIASGVDARRDVSDVLRQQHGFILYADDSQRS